MTALRSIDELEQVQRRLVDGAATPLPVIVIPGGTCGRAAGATDLIEAVAREIRRRDLEGRVRLLVTGCHGYCHLEPALLVEPGGTLYPQVALRDVERIVEALGSGRVVEELLPVDPSTGHRIERQADLPFFKHQIRTILSQHEKLDPLRVDSYLENGGYRALLRVLRAGRPGLVIEEVKAARLRGRGGAGFPTDIKWEELAAKNAVGGKFLVCDADEGDPGAYMNRVVLEGNPHSIIEGMLIGAYGTGATEGIVYVRHEHPLAVRSVLTALRQAEALGLLGEDILGSGFSFRLRLVRGAGAFVCGEETALVRSVEGFVGEPRQRPPHPVERGIEGRPTVINNVETWANIPIIFAQGASEYVKVGRPNNAGTKVFNLVGNVRNTGVVEVPMGTPIRDIVYGIGGGPVGRRMIKAVQLGGPSGGCVPYWKFDLPVDYDSLKETGTLLGAGGMVVLDEDTCMVDIARYFTGFLRDESCGKCFTCRKGTQRMYEILDDISRGTASMDQLDLLSELGHVVQDTALCGFGHTAASPALSALWYFRREFQRHVHDKRCDAFVCRELTGAPCQSACPLGIEVWRAVGHLARGEHEAAYSVIRAANPFPSVCARVCTRPCEARCRLGPDGYAPLNIHALARFITERADPAAFEPERQRREGPAVRVAVVGAGPAGLTAAHLLALRGYRVTLHEAAEPGGMLLAATPEYRLPREVLHREIGALVNDERIALRCHSVLGRDMTLDTLFADGNKAVFLALGAHRARRLDIEGESGEGVQRALPFLSAFRRHGEQLAHGRVGVIGGGDRAIDAARVALRQPGVTSVTLFYRRSRAEMPAQEPEVRAALEEGVQLTELVAPARVQLDHGRLQAVTFVRTRLGPLDASGRRCPAPVPGTERTVPLDTLIVAVGEQLRTFNQIEAEGLEYTREGIPVTDPDTLTTSRPDVFAGGHMVTGPGAVIEAIAAGKRAAVMIDRSVRGEELRQPARPAVPAVFVEPLLLGPDELAVTPRAEPETLPLAERRTGFGDVERTLSAEAAAREARRCLRCDLAFTRRQVAQRGGRSC